MLSLVLAIICLFAFLLTIATLLMTKEGERGKRIALAAMGLAMLVATGAFAGGDLRTTLPSTVALHSKDFTIAPQPLAATNAFRTSTVITGLTTSTVILPSTAIVPGVVGRNVTVTQTNAGGSTNPVVTWNVKCFDQFGVQWAEDIVANNTTIGIGAKVCQTFISATPSAVTGVEAGDTVVFGTGNVVGLPFMFSPDLHEIKGLERVIAAGTTQTAITINTTNLDILNFACKATCFSASAVVNGDSLSLLVRTDDRSPDNRYYPQR